MKNYQKYLKKFIALESKFLEEMRVALILSVALIFGVVLQQVMFSDTTQTDIVKADNASEKKYTASVVGGVKFLPEQKEGDLTLSQSTESSKAPIASSSVELVKEKEIKKESISMLEDVVVADSNPNFLPIRNLNLEKIPLDVKSAIVLSEDKKVLFEKNINERLPIASLTKIMSALVILENIKEGEVITITKEAIATEGVSGRFTIGEKLPMEDLLKIMLIVSSNDAAEAFYEYFKSNDVDMIALMNKKAEDLGLKDTKFSNPVGFDDPDNYSTANDYANLILHSLSNKKLWSILAIKDGIVKAYSDGFSDRRLISSNKLMFDKDMPGLLGGKTGYTQNAGGTLMIAFNVYGKNGRDDSIVVSVVLGADNTSSRFTETKKLINWIRSAYIF